MKIVVTGATGLVGSRLLQRLHEQGLDCHAVVRRPGSAPAGVTEVVGDLFDGDTLTRALDRADAVVHLAALFRSTDEDLIWRTNLDGTRNLIEATRRVAPETRLIMASTSHVYGTGGGRPGREDDPVAATAAYPASKIAAEKLLSMAGLTWTILRYGFVYGDGDGHLDALPALVAGGSMHPAARMSMVHHRDIATVTGLALAGALDGQIVNVGDEAAMSLYELVRLAGGSMDASADPLPNPWHLVMDGSLARRLGFRPAVRTVHQAVADGLL
ncbi:NAD(P)-dependent oxidoreductase [Mycolicibacterium neoaurum]|uniref:NAD-dependent epimerase/dehydratase family protein n=1 Tax=Mycolicibacterium neoaurum TaxID=1795 RepID=UPI00248B7BA2|nr:NAD(P)-dependent oxidoreductase [Mycolicibacterium neoaurum]WBP93735.1 NAD(P)-dependent oxidoreductase [Mycolicibacterium neoaurum]WBS07488.1 NAD(P)-dependent oxidoreductase [Mycolicibacterium neoaurum]